jgi:NADH:ubiquinone oxidoreductase subunit K
VVLLRSGRAQLTGAAAGMVGVGALGWLTRRSTAMVLAGATMVLLALYVAVAFPERRFVPAATRRWSAARSTLVRGSALVRGSRAILVMFAAALLGERRRLRVRAPLPLRLVGIGSAAVLLAAGALPLTRTIGTIWVNRQTGSHVRATVHSLLAQASAVGEVACGLALAAVVRLTGLPRALASCGVLLLVAVGLVRRLGGGDAERTLRLPIG